LPFPLPLDFPMISGPLNEFCRDTKPNAPGPLGCLITVGLSSLGVVIPDGSAGTGGGVLAPPAPLPNRFPNPLGACLLAGDEIVAYSLILPFDGRAVSLGAEARRAPMSGIDFFVRRPGSADAFCEADWLRW
jgi:hypothetical protein